MIDRPIILNPGAPVTLAIVDYGIYPLTPCCQASAKGLEDCIGCRGCYREIDPLYGDVWSLEDEQGWDTYDTLLLYQGVRREDAASLVTAAREQAAATGLATKPLRKPRVVAGTDGSQTVVWD